MLAPTLFRVVHRAVGPSDQLVGVDVLVGDDPDAQADRDLPTVDPERRRGRILDALGDAVTLDAHMRAHAHLEDHIRRLKDSGLERFPFCDLDANRAQLAVVCFADSLVCWFQLLCLTGALAAAEPKGMRWTLWHAPARLVRKAGRHVVRILDDWPTAGELLDAYQRVALIT